MQPKAPWLSSEAPRFEGQTALVTGARGFIGRRLVQDLESRGCRVLADTGNLAGLAARIDRCDIVFHLAAAMKAEANGGEGALFQANVDAAEEAARISSRTGARCIFASSSSVYGSGTKPLPSKESDPLLADTVYGRSKKESEKILAEAAARDGFGVIALRVFNAYGPGQKREFLIPYLAESLRRGERARVRRPQSVRDFVYVDDAVRAFICAAAARLPGFHALNVGTGEGISIRDAARLLAAQLKAKDLIDWEPEAPADYSVADPALIRAVLGWKAQIRLEEGLSRVAKAPDAS